MLPHASSTTESGGCVKGYAAKGASHFGRCCFQGASHFGKGKRIRERFHARGTPTSHFRAISRPLHTPEPPATRQTCSSVVREMPTPIGSRTSREAGVTHTHRDPAHLAKREMPTPIGSRTSREAGVTHTHRDPAHLAEREMPTPIGSRTSRGAEQLYPIRTPLVGRRGPKKRVQARVLLGAGP